MFMFASLIALVLLIWMVVKIWKRSALLAVLSFLFWPALVFSLFKYWGDEESDIKVPFFIFLPVIIYAWYDINQTAKALHEQQEGLLSILQSFA